MKQTIFFLYLFLTFSIFSQNKFVFNENGLVPKYITSNAKNLTENEIHKKTLKWIETTSRNINLETHSLNKNNISFTGIQDNAVRIGKQYYHLKYTIKIRFEEGKYNFEPTQIQTKLNSKYDFGWTDFNLRSGTSFFKKGKAIKKTQSYVKDIPAILNGLSSDLTNYLITNNSKE